jgi:hypothetical protein
MPGKQEAALAGLLVTAIPNGERGVYFTDEILEVKFLLKNQINKMLRGKLTVFYGFGPSGTEGRTSEDIKFDIQPDSSQEITALKRLVGIQGNGVIGMCLPAVGGESAVIVSENDKERVLRASLLTPSFHTLYTFASMEREFYKRFYKRPEELMDTTKKLTNTVVALTAGLLLLTFVSIAISLLIGYGIIHP